MSAPAVPSLSVFDELPQEILIQAVGADVPRFPANRPAHDPAPDEVIPDPVELFAGALNQQMFSRPDDRRCVSSARVLERSGDAARRLQTWKLLIEDAHPSCLRVLHNLLAARDLDSVIGHGAAPSPRARRLDPARLPYPPARPKLPFLVEREEVLRSYSDRLIQVEFTQPPPDDLVDSVSAVMELWCDLLLLGGYPAEDMHPRESGVLPDGPILLDEVTVQLAFPEAFQADEAAFNCMLNHFHCFSQREGSIAALRIR